MTYENKIKKPSFTIIDAKDIPRISKDSNKPFSIFFREEAVPLAVGKSLKLDVKQVSIDLDKEITLKGLAVTFYWLINSYNKSTYRNGNLLIKQRSKEGKCGAVFLEKVERK